MLRVWDPNAEIAVGQTFNIKDGLVNIDTSRDTDFLKGTLEIDAGGGLYNGDYWAEPGATQWHVPLSATGGTLAFKDRGLLFLPSGQEGVYENINITTSGTPFVVLGSGPWGESPSAVETYNLTAAGTPKMLALLKASNLWISADYDETPVEFAGEGVTVGDGKWIQGIDGRTKSSKVAGNIKADPGTTIGFAGIVDQLTVDANIVAPNATVRFNTTDTLETCVYVNSNPAGNAHTNTRLLGVVPSAKINVNGMVTVETILAQNGQVQFAQDLTVPNLNIASGATVTMSTGKTATVTDTLSGTGKWTGGNGVTLDVGATIAPGESIGIINDGGGNLTFEDGAIYAWQVANAGGVEGQDWDLIKGGSFTFEGLLILDIDDSLLVGDIDLADSFIIASASGTMGAVDTYSFTGNWSGTLTVDGKNLVLTNLTDTLSGDVNGDGVADARDYIILKGNLGLGSGASLAHGDLDGDGDVDWDDLSAMRLALAAPASGTIPEPATLGLLAIGALALIRRRRA
jgi:hypothetical protein